MSFHGIDVPRTDALIHEEIQPQASSPHQSGYFRNRGNVNTLIPKVLVTPFLRNPSSQTTLTIPDNHQKLCIPSNTLNLSSYSPFSRNLTLLHGASINGNKSHLLNALSEGGLRWLESRDKFGRTALVYACIGNHPECAAILLSSGASTISVDDFGRNAFHWAAIMGSYECYKLMFKHESKSIAIYGASNLNTNDIGWKMKEESGASPLHLSTCPLSTKCLSYILKNADPNEVIGQDNRKRTPLHWATAAGNDEAIRILLKFRAGVGLLDENGKPPFFYAASSVREKSALCIKLLLEKLPDAILWQDFEGRSALHLAIADQELCSDVINVLLSYCNNWEKLKDKNKRTPLHWAAMLGKTLFARILLSRVVEITSMLDEYGATPLHYAALSNNPEIIKLMYNLNQELLDIKDHQGRTALMWAANENSCESIHELVNLGANSEYSDDTGRSALHIASAKGSTKAVKLLIKLGANVNTIDENGNTPFLTACELNHFDIFMLLKEFGANTETMNIYHRKPIHLAVRGRNPFILFNLLQENMVYDVNCKDIKGLTPLHLACKEGSSDCTSILVENGVDCNVQDNEGYTPLHYAVQGCHVEIVQMLLDHDVNLNIPNNSRKTALDICNELGHQMIADWLSKKGAIASSNIICI